MSIMGSKIFSRNCFQKIGFGDRGFTLMSSGTKHLKFNNFRTCYCVSGRQNSLTSAQLFKSKLRNSEKWFMTRNLSAEAPVKKIANDVQIKSYFEEMLHKRKHEAHRSVLVEVTDKDEIPFALGHFQKYGSIANIYSYPGESKNYFLLIEFSSEIEAKNLLSNCGFQNIDDVFPVCSRIIRYERKSNCPAPKDKFIINEETNVDLSTKPGATISEVIQDIFSNEKLTELDTRLRFLLCALIKDSLSGLFPLCDVYPFGSSVNGLGKRGCDLDIVIRLYPEKVNSDDEIVFLNKTCIGKHKNLQQRTLSRLGEYFLFSPGVSLTDRVMFARVPILKMNHRILKLDFDVSVNNMSAILMSDILHFCGEIDPRVRPLIHVVKKWAKEANITRNSPGTWITNFGLSNLVLFFLQNLKQPILPPLNDALIIIGSDNSYNFRLQYLKSIEDWKKVASSNKETIGTLLKEFLVFLTTYPFHESIISLLSGESRSRDDNCTPLYLEYALDESLNITKNVSKAEYDLMCEKAKISLKSLENNLNRKVSEAKDISALLSISTISRLGIKNQKFDVSSVIENEKPSRNRNVKYR